MKHVGTVGVQIRNKQGRVQEEKAVIKGIPWHFNFFFLATQGFCPNIESVFCVGTLDEEEEEAGWSRGLV